MLGIEDRSVALAYLLCLASTALCVYYAWRNWNRGNEPVEVEDEKWSAEEKHVEDNL
jgi:hypothetical protein